MINNKTENFFNKHPVFNNINKLINKFINDDIFGLSAELTFYFMAAFFPYMILLLALISITPLSLEDTIFKLLAILPKEVYQIIRYVLTTVSKSPGIIAFSTVIALWSTSSVAATINKALNRMYRVNETRHFLIIRSIGFIFAIIFAITMVLAFVLIVMGNVIGAIIMKYAPSFYIVWHAMRISLVYLIALGALFTIYKVLPNKKLKFKEVILGAFFTTSIWAIASFLFSFYVDNFADYHIIYGSLAGVGVLMTWLYISSFILLTGGQVNSILYLHNKKITAHVNDKQ